MKRISAVMLLLFMTMSLFGCTAKTDADTAPQTAEATTAPQETAEETQALIDTEVELIMSLLTNDYTRLDASMKLEAEAILKSGELDGNDNTLIGPRYMKGFLNTQNAVTMRSGKLSNIHIKYALRCVGDTPKNRPNGPIHLENVTLNSPTYALNFNYGDFTHPLTVDDSKLCGWSSYTGFASATFTNCTFGWDSTGKNGNLCPHVDTVLKNCSFKGKSVDDGRVIPFNIKLKDTIFDVTITLENCYVGDTLITTENVNDLLGIEMFTNTLVIDNTED